MHTVLYPTCEGGYFDRDDGANCSREHFRKLRFCSVAETFRAAEEVRL